MTHREGEWHQELRRFAATMRIALEPGMPRDAKGEVDSAGTCLYACVALVAMLGRFDVAVARIRGGEGRRGEGALTVHGDWIGHYWVEATAVGTADPVVLDITSDQLGYETVTVISLEASVGRYKPGRQDLVDTAATEIAAEMGLSALHGA